MIALSERPSAVHVSLCDRSSSPEELYALLVAIRTFEQSLLDMFGKGQLVGTTHTCLGQEATAVGVVSAIDREQHLHHRNFYSNGIQGGIVPVATGMALAEKQRGSGAVVVVFLGDGTLGEGVVYESLNLASLWQLPILFVIENNGYAQSTPSSLQLAGSIRARPEAFGIAVSERATTDVRQVLSLAGEAVDRVRAECRPHCLLLHTDRLGPHSKGDDHRDPEELRAAWERDPLRILRPAVGELWAEQIEVTVLAEILGAQERALEAVSHG
jgi:TPP-dependent pyruvate/acetoin dehydrogenase alpha subunit